MNAKPDEILSIEHDYRPQKGWVYILISDDKKHLKIGKTSSCLARRIKSVNTDEYSLYRGKNFELLIAFIDANHERPMQSLWSSYRANYRWSEPENESTGLTSSKIYSLARKRARALEGENYTPTKTRELLRRYSKPTSLELFALPKKARPEKILETLRKQNKRLKELRKSRKGFNLSEIDVKLEF